MKITQNMIIYLENLKYLSYLYGINLLNLFLNILRPILETSSCTVPKGHIHPQNTGPKNMPKIITKDNITKEDS